MKKQYCQYFIFFILIVSSLDLGAQDWECAKERDGIKIYTCHDSASSYKLFKGEIDLQSDITTVSNLVEDVRNVLKWDEDVSLIKILDSEPGKFVQYYVQYNVQWPFANRDLCAEADIETNPVTGERVILSRSEPDALPKDPEFVRIENFWQKWTISPAGEGKVHLTLEGFADPAGDIPAWLGNMAITNSPLNMLKKIRETVQ